jgi:hypothetical protein
VVVAPLLVLTVAPLVIAVALTNGISFVHVGIAVAVVGWQTCKEMVPLLGCRVAFGGFADCSGYLGPGFDPESCGTPVYFAPVDKRRRVTPRRTRRIARDIDKAPHAPVGSPKVLLSTVLLIGPPT